jgi:hypothetical protein
LANGLILLFAFDSVLWLLGVLLLLKLGALATGLLLAFYLFGPGAYATGFFFSKI